ncbi:MAG TPA: glycosyltransferase [Allosphingosinicella sp.]|jgi:glycosyltransferase involved in cell wall biosynthesis
MSAPVRILHVHSTFNLGGKEARAVRLMNAFGDSAEHTILSASPGQTEASEAIAPEIDVDFPDDGPQLTGVPTPRRLWAIAKYMEGFDLVLTYNWGAFDAVMARRLYAPFLKLPPLVHHEDGFNQDETAILNPKRNRYRRLGLGAAYRLVVPSHRLEHIALAYWGRKPRNLLRIANGIPIAPYAAPPAEDAIPGLVKGEGEVVVGTVAGLRPVKNLPRLVRAFAAMSSRKARLVIVGSGPECETICAEARRLGVAARLHMPGFLSDPAEWIGRFDIFALSSDSEQQPISLIEAMAAGLPCAATSVGDIPAMVAPENRPLIVPPQDEAALAAALDTLAGRADLRAALGSANRAKAAAEFDEGAMIAAYARLYCEAISRPGALGAHGAA